MCGLPVGQQRLAGGRRDAGASSRTASGRRSRRPSPRPASRTPGCRREAITTSRLGLPARGADEPVDRGGQRVRIAARIARRAQPAGLGHVPDPDHLRAADARRIRSARARRARRRWPTEATGCRQQHRRPDRRSHQHRGGDRRLPVVGGRDRDRRRVGARRPRGYTASATPAASATGSPPATAGGVLGRHAGNPSCAAGASSTDSPLLSPPRADEPLAPPPQPARRLRAGRQREQQAGRIGADVSARPGRRALVRRRADAAA